MIMKKYLIHLFTIGLAFVSTTGYCQNKVWPYPIPCRINASISANVLFLSLGDITTSVAEGTFYPVEDKVVLNNGTVIENYYRDSLGFPYYKPIDKTYYPTAPAGWCSWNAYRDDITSDTIKHVVDFFSAKLKDFGLKTILIDGGWEDHWYTWKPYLPNFPQGIQAVAKNISDHGFQPGLWIVPQGTDDSAQPKLFDAFIKNPDGSPKYTGQWGYTVDPTSPQGQEYVSQLMDTVHNWGFTYCKIDAQPYLDRYYDTNAVNMRVPNMPHEYYYRQFVSAVRQGVGRDVYLDGTWGPGLYYYAEGTWAPYTSVDYFNGGRPYWDIVEPTGRWATDVFCGMICYEYINNIVCYLDLDDYYVRDTTDFDQARSWATMIGLGGTTMMDEDPIAQLSEDRIEIMRRIYPTVDIRPIDLYNSPDRRKHVWDLKINQRGRLYDVVGFFKSDFWYNSDLAIRWNEMGWNPDDKYHVYDFWNKQYLGEWSNDMPVDAPVDECRLFSFVKAEDYPELISTSRHITQGWVDLDTLAYDTASMVMSGISSVVGDDPYQLRFAVPNDVQNSYRAVSAEVDGLPFKLSQDSNFITLDFTSPQSVHVSWKVYFTKGPLAVKDESPKLDKLTLFQNYPNPFGIASPAKSDFSTFSFYVAHSEPVRLSIYDLMGRRIADVYNGYANAGTYQVGFDGTNLPSGVYFSVLQADHDHQVKALMIEQ